MYSVDEISVDVSGKYNARVIIDENTTRFFKFNHEPSQEEIDAEVAKYLESRIPVDLV